MNKKSLKLAALLTLICVVVSLASCSVSKPISDADFVAAAKELGYEVQTGDLSEGVLSFSYVENDKVYVEFWVFDTVDHAKSDFSAAEKYIDNNRGKVATGSVTTNMPSKQRYSLTSDGKYYIVIRVGATLVFGESTSENKAAVGEIIKAIKYL